MNKRSLPSSSIWLPILIGILLLPVPLLGDFHIESALLAALAGCFWAALQACGAENGSSLGQIKQILRSLYLFGLPLFLYALLSGCFSWHGLGFWILYPIPSVLFGYTLGRMLRIWEIPFRKTIAVCILLFFALGIPLIQFFNLPQVYFFNHVWGGWPGPIYDETVRVSWALGFFRALTLAWAGLFWALPGFGRSAKEKAVVLICATLLLSGYLFLPQLGIISPRSYIQKQLGGVKQIPHFILYYEKSGYTQDEIGLIALEHEFYLEQITEALNISKPDSTRKIESYLYAHAWQKNRLTGAKFTSYVPVWLGQDQLHIAKQQLESLKHELVHILAKRFGNRVLNASWSIGLVEGLAVALAPDVSPRTTVHQIVAAEKPWPGVSAMRNALSLTGFYGGRATVNYTTTGSFVRYLLNRYPVKYFKQAYATTAIDEAYPQSFKKLIQGWHKVLRRVEVDSLDQQIAARLFSIPSLFEKACPHVLSPFSRHWQEFRYYLVNEDTADALNQLNLLRAIEPGDTLVKNRWVFMNLKTGNINKVQSMNLNRINAAVTRLKVADAFALNAEWDSARTVIQNIVPKPDSVPYFLQQALKVRKNKQQWQHYLDLVYRNRFFKNETFHYLNDYTQMLAIKKTIERERWQLFTRYANTVTSQALNKHYFDLYLTMVRYLGYRRQFELARRLIKKISHLPLRKRYKQRLKQQKRWIQFLKKQDLVKPTQGTFHPNKLLK